MQTMRRRFRRVVEASLNDVLHGRYKSDMKAHAAMQSLMAFTVRYGTSFICAGSRVGAEYVTFSLLAKYLYELTQRFKLSTQVQGDTGPGGRK